MGDGSSLHDAPTLAVVMPVFNAMPFLDAAIESMLRQTKSDFEFCIYDDHSADGSFECAQAWARRDSRIRVERGAHRLGPVGSSNAAMAMTKADLVARMDADDISDPQRLEMQYSVFISHPKAVLVGSTFRLINRAGNRISPGTADRLIATDIPFRHPTIMVRRSAFDAAGGYRAGTDYFEDNDLYARLAEQGKCLVLRKPLVDVRMAGQHARLHDNRESVLAQLDRWAHAGPGTAGAKPRFAVNTIRTMARLHVYNLRRPDLVRLTLRQGSFAHLRSGLTVLGLVASAQVSPRLTLGGLQLAWWYRERKVARLLGQQMLFKWTPRPTQTVQPLASTDCGNHGDGPCGAPLPARPGIAG